MNYYLKRQLSSTQQHVIARYGSAVWDDLVWKPESFTLKDVAELPCLSHLSDSTRLLTARIVIANVEAELEQLPPDSPEIPFVKTREGHAFRYVWRDTSPVIAVETSN